MANDVVNEIKQIDVNMAEPSQKVCTEDCKKVEPKTLYEVLMSKMTPQQMATLGVKLISVNNSELWWVTSSGQLYPFNNRDQAIQAEFNWLMSEP